jgi:hypothetical protein
MSCGWTIGDALPYATFWLCLFVCIGWCRWVRFLERKQKLQR